MHCGLSQKLKTNRWLGGLHQWLKAGRGTSDDDLMVGWIHYRVRCITYLLIRSSSTIFCSMTCTSRVKYTFKMSDSLVLWRLIPLWQRTKTSHLTSACCPDRERLQVAFACVSNDTAVVTGIYLLNSGGNVTPGERRTTQTHTLSQHRVLKFQMLAGEWFSICLHSSSASASLQSVLSLETEPKCTNKYLLQ